MDQIVWLIPILPLLGFIVVAFLHRMLGNTLVSAVACGTILGSFLLSIYLFTSFDGNGQNITYFDWINIASLHVPFAFLIDGLSLVMLLVVTGIGFLIHLYSVGYMHDDERFPQFMSYLNLFVFFMLLLVMGNNYIVMFTGWEGVGLCSYLLIGFWFKNHSYNNAANKAFIMNRIGDLGFLLGIFLIWTTFDSVIYSEVFGSAESYSKGDKVITSITLLLFIGAMGKSAQIPLYTWLPDAMAGPTPVSALIHAATMVTAGVYMVVRSNILYTLSPDTLNLILGIGLATAFFAATIGLYQNDIKKVLAYSTVSQLGFMFIGLGVGAYTAGIFHLVTHAFFKALLFLGAGSVIHAMGGEQDIRKMGGLRSSIKITYLTFLIGTIAISGIPPFSGFFSKDEILMHLYSKSPLLWFIGIVSSALTAFYMFRLLFLTFWGDFRGTKHQADHLHESPYSMTVPLMILALLAFVGGALNIPEVMGGNTALHHFLQKVLESTELRFVSPHLTHTTEYVLMIIAVAIAAISSWFAYDTYVVKTKLPVGNEDDLKNLVRIIYHKYYIDELYEKGIVKPLNWISRQINKHVEPKIIDGTVEGSANIVLSFSGTIRQLQTGSIGFYLVAMVLSFVLLFALALII